MENKPITTIKIRRETKRRLDKFKEHDKETYEEVIRKLLFILNASKKNPERAQKIIRKIDSIIKRKERNTKVYQNLEREEKMEVGENRTREKKEKGEDKENKIKEEKEDKESKEIKENNESTI